MRWPVLIATVLVVALPASQAADDSDTNLQDSSTKNCYTCVGNADDRTCEVAPEKVTTGAPYLPCKRKYCTITRQEYTDNPGTVVQISRGCENALPHADGKEVTDEFTIYYWTCSSNLCNTGDGTKAPAGGGGGGGGTLPYVLVPGMAGAAATGATAMVVGMLLMLLNRLQ